MPLNIDLHAISPELAITAALLVVLVIDVFLPRAFKVFNASIAITRSRIPDAASEWPTHHLNGSWWAA